jgi:hypothetical protein
VFEEQGLDPGKSLLDARKTLRVDPLHFGHAGIDFRHPGQKGRLILNQRRLILE